MIRKKDLMVAILATFCLTSTLLLAVPIRSQSPSQSGIGTYDPTADLNHDGSVDIYDAIILANHYDTSGDPTLNVTENCACVSSVITPTYTSGGYGSWIGSASITTQGYRQITLYFFTNSTVDSETLVKTSWAVNYIPPITTQYYTINEFYIPTTVNVTYTVQAPTLSVSTLTQGSPLILIYEYATA